MYLIVYIVAYSVYLPRSVLITTISHPSTTDAAAACDPRMFTVQYTTLLLLVSDCLWF